MIFLDIVHYDKWSQIFAYFSRKQRNNWNNTAILYKEDISVETALFCIKGQKELSESGQCSQLKVKWKGLRGNTTPKGSKTLCHKKTYNNEEAADSESKTEEESIEK